MRSHWPGAAEPLISRLAPSDACDTDLVGAITTLVNDVYSTAEAGLWQSGTTRTTAAEVAAAIGSGQIIGASVHGQVTGVVQTSMTDGVGWFGMLAVGTRSRRVGIGGRLVTAAEQLALSAGASAMRITVLTPTESTHSAKAGLARWYRSLGYARLGSLDMSAELPALVPLLAVPCHLEVLGKELQPFPAN